MDQNKEFNTAALNAWYATKLERDKHLFSISSVGIGVLVTLVTTVGLKNYYAAIIFFLAVFAFFSAICAILWIFNANADYLVAVVSGSDEPSLLLAILDRIALSSFLLGMIFSVIFGIFSAIDNINKEPVMSGENKAVYTNTPTVARESYNGINKMRKPMQDQSPNQASLSPTPSPSQQANQPTESNPSE
ncbi:hypothetical protein ACX843_003574 [Vibrio cholerae]|nr:hypothetical protein [Vibrio cholerae]